MNYVMGAWRGVAMDSLKLYSGLPCPSLLLLSLLRPAAVFYPFDTPRHTPMNYIHTNANREKKSAYHRFAKNSPTHRN
jgi:hypothetical protein